MDVTIGMKAGFFPSSYIYIVIYKYISSKNSSEQTFQSNNN